MPSSSSPLPLPSIVTAALFSAERAVTEALAAADVSNTPPATNRRGTPSSPSAPAAAAEGEDDDESEQGLVRFQRTVRRWIRMLCAVFMAFGTLVDHRVVLAFAIQTRGATEVRPHFFRLLPPFSLLFLFTAY